MPTGGGKSLCYQLPAVAMERTCVVVSPLIALMQDQAAQLQTAGIAAAFLNSSLSLAAQRETIKRAQQGALRRLYLSPERLVRDDTLEWLKRVPLAFFAIDEAHCISEWGHEFRPEYRRLRALREWFPETPIAAFTASATRAVRHDIVAQLHLNDPAKCVMSFHRPNLRYIAHQCGTREQEPLVRAALEYYNEGSVILYAPTVKSVDETVAVLSRRGLPVIGYHGQMDTGRRQQNQEMFMSGEKRILVGTIAFGLGINKPTCAPCCTCRCRNRWSSIIRRRAAPAATVWRRIASCYGRSATPGCWRTSSSSWRTRGNASDPGSVITRCGGLSKAPSAAIARSASISARLRRGSAAMRATSAASSWIGWKT